MRKSKMIKGTLILLAMLIMIPAALLIYFHFTQFQPRPTEPLSRKGSARKEIKIGDTLTAITLNMGYGGLSYDTDFVMDGGSMVNPPSADLVKRNTEGVLSDLAAENADIYFLQEIDKSSSRSYHIDQVHAAEDTLSGVNSFAANFKSQFVPYPFPETIGRVYSGIMTSSAYAVSKAERIALYIPYKWPVSIFQLKRCLLVSRIPLAKSNQQLILINLHLDAYDDGSGKIEQTKTLASLMQAEYQKGNYVIAGGDFNQTFPGSDPNLYPLVKKEHFMPGTIDASLFPKEWKFLYDETVPTSRLCNMPYDPQSDEMQHYVIDGFIVSPNIICEEVRTLDWGFTYTDHNPVQVRLTLAHPPQDY